MGQHCTKAPIQSEPYQEQPDITFKDNKSSYDHFYTLIENRYNFLKHFQLHEYLTLLANINKDPNSILPNPSQDIKKFDFQTFIENKIMKNFLIITLLENTTTSAIFKDYMLELYDSVLMANINLFKKLNPSIKLKKGEINSIKKIHVICFGMLYCISRNDQKINFLFNLFSDEKENFVKSKELDEFIYYLFIIPSTSSFRALKKVSDRYTSELDKIEDSDFLKIVDAFEIDDIFRLKKIFLDGFFKEKEFLTKTEFERNFIEGDFGWIFNAKGIREFLEKHNDVKENNNQ